MDRAEALRRIGDERVARLATIGSDGPHLVPVVFAFDGGRVVTAVDQKPKRTRDLQRLKNIVADPRVSLLADQYDDDWSRLWWVRVDGTARIVRTGAEFVEVLALLADKYQQYRSDPPRGPAIVIEVGRVAWWSAEPPRV